MRLFKSTLFCIPVRTEDQKNDQLFTANLIRKSVREALKCAEQTEVRGIAFPGMGTGVGGLSLEEAASVMVREIKDHIDERTSLKQVFLVGFTDDTTRAFERVIYKALGGSHYLTKCSL